METDQKYQVNNFCELLTSQIFCESFLDMDKLDKNCQ